jgi:hypothetical protein
MIDCPKCSKLLKPEKGVRFITNGFADKYQKTYSKLQKYKCDGRKGCKYAFLVQKDFPMDDTLAIQITLHERWEVWNKASKSRPGSEPGQTTVSDYTDWAHRDPAVMITDKKGKVSNLFLSRYYQASKERDPVIGLHAPVRKHSTYG